MAITEFAKNYHEKMFPEYHSPLWETDPEFMERFDNFAFDEVVNQDCGFRASPACRKKINSR